MFFSSASEMLAANGYTALTPAALLFAMFAHPVLDQMEFPIGQVLINVGDHAG